MKLRCPLSHKARRDMGHPAQVIPTWVARTKRGIRARRLVFWAIMPRMPPAATGATKAVGMVPDEMKFEPKSKGLATPRKKKPKELAVITECCTGCAGSPACVEYCPVEDCMFWVREGDQPPVAPTQIDPIR